MNELGIFKEASERDAELTRRSGVDELEILAETSNTDDEFVVTPGAPTIPVPRRASLRDAIILKLYNRNTQRIILNVVIILLVGLYTHAMTGKFFTPRNLNALAIQIAVVTVLACAMTLVMVAGSIDLSVSGIVALTGVVAGQLILAGVPVWLAFIMATLAGVVVGLANSFLVITTGIPSMIATIGTLYVCVGVANIITNGLPFAGLPPSFSIIGSGFVLGVPIVLPIMIGMVGLFTAIQRYTRLGRHIVATGSDAHAAFLNGVNVTRTRMLCFLLSGAAAGFGGVMYASRLGNATPVLDQDLLFQVIVAIVVGGTSLFGGWGSVVGTLTGSILIGVVNQTLNLLGVYTFWQYVALGVILVLSVAADEVFRTERARKLYTRFLPRVSR
jgi:ribose transport system permease protein